MPFVNYQVEMTPENAPLIDQINRLVIGDAYTEEASAKSTSKNTSKPAAEKTTKAETKDTGGAAEDEMSLADFKAVVKKAKADHGEDFCKETLEANGAKAGPLGRMVSAIDAEDYADVVAALEAGPADSGKEDPEDDDDFDDEEEDDDSEVDAEAVKKAAKAYAKEVGRDEAKEIMNKHGAATLTKIGECSEKQLQAMFKEFTA